MHRDRYGENLTEYFSVDCAYPAKTEQKMERILKQYRYAITKRTNLTNGINVLNQNPGGINNRAKIRTNLTVKGE